MKILYAIQGTGNGHVSRAREILPYLSKYGEVDVLISGTHAEVGVGQPILYQYHGMGFKFGKNGGISMGESLKQLKPWQFIRDMFDLPIKSYDVLLNDFEPISAYAAKRAGMPVHALSHQAAFLSSNCPRPAKKNRFAEWLFRNYAPSTHQTAFHFKSYDSFIYSPVIRKEVRALYTSRQDHISVYLPAYEAKNLIPHFHACSEVKWHLFSKHDQLEHWEKNVWIRPVNNEDFLSSLASSIGLLTGGGFESPAEALFLEKQLLVIPMTNQYEQQCNAAALWQMGIPVLPQIDTNFSQELQQWLRHPSEIHLSFPDQTEHLLEGILKSKIK